MGNTSYNYTLRTSNSVTIDEVNYSSKSAYYNSVGEAAFVQQKLQRIHESKEN